MAEKVLIDTVKEVSLVSDRDVLYVLAWGIHNNNVICSELRPREEGGFDFLVEEGALPVFSPAAGIARLPEEIFVQICVYGKNGPVCIPFKK